MDKRTTGKKSSFGSDLIDDMKLVLAHQRGTVELERVWPKPIDVKAIRKRQNVAGGILASLSN
jgi:hypothetical protein